MYAQQRPRSRLVSTFRCGSTCARFMSMAQHIRVSLSFIIPGEVVRSLRWSLLLVSVSTRACVGSITTCSTIPYSLQPPQPSQHVVYIHRFSLRIICSRRASLSPQASDHPNQKATRLLSHLSVVLQIGPASQLLSFCEGERRGTHLGQYQSVENRLCLPSIPVKSGTSVAALGADG